MKAPEVPTHLPGHPAVVIMQLVPAIRHHGPAMETLRELEALLLHTTAEAVRLLTTEVQHLPEAVRLLTIEAAHLLEATVHTHLREVAVEAATAHHLPGAQEAA